MTLITDIKYGFRMLNKHAFINSLAILALAVGIGANSALFTMIYSVLLSPLPFTEPDRVMLVRCDIRGLDTGASGPDYLDWKVQNEVFSELAAIERDAKINMTGIENPMTLKGWRVTTDFYDLLAAKP